MQNHATRRVPAAHRNRRVLAAGLAVALGAAIVGAAPAAAEGSNWWYDYYSVADAHAAG